MRISNKIKHDLVSRSGIQFSGMNREIDTLVKEKTKLLEEKNALEKVENDLVTLVDKLSR